MCAWRDFTFLDVSARSDCVVTACYVLRPITRVRGEGDSARWGENAVVCCDIALSKIA